MDGGIFLNWSETEIPAVVGIGRDSTTPPRRGGSSGTRGAGRLTTVTRITLELEI